MNDILLDQPTWVDPNKSQTGLPPSLPRSAVPKRSPQETCTEIPSSESVSRESDLSQGGSKMFNVCDEWTTFIKCTKGS